MPKGIAGRRQEGAVALMASSASHGSGSDEQRIFTIIADRNVHGLES
jgi:hypothetical protein